MYYYIYLFLFYEDSVALKKAFMLANYEFQLSLFGKPILFISYYSNFALLYC